MSDGEQELKTSPPSAIQDAPNDASTVPESDTSSINLHVDENRAIGGTSDSPGAAHKTTAVKQDLAESPDAAVANKTTTSNNQDVRMDSLDSLPINGHDEDTPKKGVAKRKLAVGSGSRKSIGKSPKTTQFVYKKGDVVLGRMKGYPPWPAIIISVEIMPSAVRNLAPSNVIGDAGAGPRGTGSYPILFFDAKNADNYAFLTVHDLSLLTPDQIDKFKPTKSTRKGLPEAYALAKSPPSYDKLKADFDSRQEESAPEELGDAVGEDDDSDAMETDSGEDKRGKKRKAEDDNSYDTAKPVKKINLKMNTKKHSHRQDSDGDKPEPKLKKKMSTPKTQKPSKTKMTQDVDEPKQKLKTDKASTPQAESPKILTEEDKAALRERKTNEMLYLRHRLQKGFLTKEAPPKEEDMAALAQYFTTLERFEGVDGYIIKGAKMDKVLKHIKNIVPPIPLDDKYHFRERCEALLVRYKKMFEDISQAEEGTEAATKLDESKPANAVVDARNGISSTAEQNDGSAHEANSLEQDEKMETTMEVTTTSTEARDPAEPVVRKVGEVPDSMVKAVD